MSDGITEPVTIMNQCLYEATLGENDPTHILEGTFTQL